jgi:glyoxylase-like metal-dependent hydrolase (beta-lactamase superfamily II)
MDSMDKPTYTPLGFGITCIDAGYVEHGMACFYLMEEGGECAVLETGTSHSVPALQQLLSARGISPQQVRYIIPTHVHLDHAGGAGAMMAVFPGAQLLIHPRGARHMADPTRLIEGALQVYGEELLQQLYGTIVPVDPARIRQMEDGQSVSLVGRRLEFRHTRGHAEHHFCVWDEVSRGWFSGDMFGVSYPWCRFPWGDFLLPSTTPSQFDPQAYLASLDLLGSYTPQRLYLTHYGALDYTLEKAQLLARQIRAYSEFAVANATDSGALQQSLSDYSVALLHQFGAKQDEAALRKWLAFDMQLNAQGLQLWQQRASGG